MQNQILNKRNRLILGLFFFCFSAHAQTGLLFHKNRYREAIYEQGDYITIRVKGEKRKLRMQIKGFEDSVIVFTNYRINPKEITDIYIDEKTQIWYAVKYKYTRLLLFAGAGYFMLDALNNDEIKQETVIISGSLIGAGLISKLLIWRRVKIKGRRKLVILH